MSDVRPSPMSIWMTAVRVGLVGRYQRRLAALGHGLIARRRCGCAGVLRVRWPSENSGDDCFQPDPMGEVVAVILPVWSNGLIDLAAWDVRGKRIATLTGDAFALGEAMIDGSSRVRIYSDPGAWWRACDLPGPLAPLAVDEIEGSEPAFWPHTPIDGRALSGPPGIVILDWSQVWRRLGHVSQVIADSVELGEQLDKALKPPRQNRPKIGVDLSRADGVTA